MIIPRVQSNLIQRLVTAQALDLLSFAYFYVIIGAQLHSEQNPIILMLMLIGGIPAVCVVKLGLPLLIAYRASKPVLVKSGRFASIYPAIRIVGISAATASGIVGAGFNLASIIHSSTGFVIR